MKVIGTHPEHRKVDPPTVRTSLLHGINDCLFSLSLFKCWGPAKQILAPLSGKIFIDIGIELVMLPLEADVSVAFICVISVVGWNTLFFSSGDVGQQCFGCF